MANLHCQTCYLIGLTFSWLHSFQFCGIGSHHQNGIAELNIRDLSDSAKASLLHAIHHRHKGDSKNLRRFALKYAWSTRNALQPSSNEKKTDDFLPGSPLSFTSDVLQYHPFGCPPFVLDSWLRGHMKIPCWEPRSQVGVYLGNYSVTLLLNPPLVMPPLNIMWQFYRGG
jgi:hypothetical protein